ncbi:hypothetical protein [Sanyastnella coralliicola]|uniref:hypothetical protein n=1 Tax=Sanyastnella coralliicola TaxID=3069118 RepID=UPI0027BA8964|nr:hypothetical protein [Longitalea sp. SCSIO 12813]
MKRWVILIIVILFVSIPEFSEAQCVMCKAVAEDSADSGGIGKGLNSGILYLMGIPYLLMVIGFVAFYRKKPTLKA